jgi:hypothetical protein
VSPARRRWPRSGVGQLDHPLLVGAAHDERPVAVVEQLLERDDLAGGSGAADSTTLSDSLRTTSAPRSRGLVVELGMHRDPHLAPAGEDVDGAVVVAGRAGAVRRGRLGELVDLVAQRGDVVARLAEGVGQLLVLRDRLGELALGLEEALLEGAHPLGGVLEAPAERGDLLLEGRACSRSSASSAWTLGLVDGDHLLVERPVRGPYTRAPARNRACGFPISPGVAVYSRVGYAGRTAVHLGSDSPDDTPLPQHRGRTQR